MALPADADGEFAWRVASTALAVRAQTLARPANQRRPVTIRPEQRFVFLTESGTPLTRAGLDNAWQDLISAATEAEVIARGQRFTLHGLKHRGITDTKAKRAEKKKASGHKTDAMVDLYDHELLWSSLRRRVKQRATSRPRLRATCGGRGGIRPSQLYRRFPGSIAERISESRSSNEPMK